MRSISRGELTGLIGRGRGVVLVDHQALGREQPSILHTVTCRWPAKTRAHTPLRFWDSTDDAVRWLRAQYGAEGSAWKRCGECSANRARNPRSPRARTERHAHAHDQGPGSDGPAHITGEIVWT